jgi:hypothetical protein
MFPWNTRVTAAKHLDAGMTAESIMGISTDLAALWCFLLDVTDGGTHPAWLATHALPAGCRAKIYAAEIPRELDGQGRPYPGKVGGPIAALTPIYIDRCAPAPPTPSHFFPNNF